MQRARSTHHSRHPGARLPACSRRNNTSGLRLAPIAAAILGLIGGSAYAATTAPVGGQVVAGSGAIAQSGTTTTITQRSQNLTLNWQSFDIGPDYTVDFNQPNSSALAVNRVIGNSGSRIFGHLNANGQVWLINPNGVIFGRQAQVAVGSILVSTLAPDRNDKHGTVGFSGAGDGKIANLGNITVAPGGYAALLANQVSNRGTITAQLGTVALGAGSALTLTFDNDRLLNVKVAANTLRSLVDNHSLVIANGGRVFMTAGARDSLIASAVNNTGVVQAQTVEQHGGTIKLLSGNAAGTTTVSGTLDASAPSGGSGGDIETSGAHVAVADTANVTTKAASGRTGDWLIDPTNYTVAASGGDETGAHLASRLDSTNVTIESSAGTTSGGSDPGDAAGGNVDIDDNVIWTSGNSLTLAATNNVNLDAQVTGGAGSALNANAGNSVNIGAGGAVSVGQATLTSTAFDNQAGANALGANWTIRSNAATVGQVTLDGLMPDFTQYDAGSAFGNVNGAASGNGVLYSTLAPTLTISDLVTGSALSKGYDGTTTAFLNAANPVNANGTVNPNPSAPNNVTVTGLVGDDRLQSIAVTSAYSQSTRGTGLAVTINPANITAAGLSVIDANGAPAYGYQLADDLTGSASMVGDITAKLLQVRVVGTPTKTYNGTTFVVPKTTSSSPTAKDQNLALVGVAPGDSIDVLHAATMNYADANAGTGKPISATFQPTDFQVTTGDAANYIFPTSLPTGCSLYCEGTILPAPIYLTGLTAESKVYDGTTAATVEGATATGFFGVIAQDQGNVALNVPAGGDLQGTFTQRDVGSNLAVELLGLNSLLTGSAAHNYALKPDIGLTANITPRPLTVTGVTAATKTYDATTAATLATAGAALTNVVAGDNVTLSTAGATGTFAQANVGKNLTITSSGFALGGTDAGNYALVQPTLATGEIDPALLDIAINGPITKTYDGTAFTVLHNANFTITGWQGTDGGQIDQSTARYEQAGVDHPDAGTGLDISDVVQVTDFANLTAGTQLSNYIWGAGGKGVVSQAGIGTINPAPLTGIIVGNPSKLYDGNANATLGSNNLQLVGVLPGQSITVDSGISAAGTYLNGGNPESNVGAWDVQSNAGAITAADFTAGSGTSLANYVLPTVFAGSGTIVPATIACSGPCITVDLTGHAQRYYDGTTAVTLDPSDFTLHLTGFVAGQGAEINQPITGNFAQKDVGNNIPISALITQSDVSGTSGTSLGNYLFSTDGHSLPAADGLSTTVFGSGDILPRTLGAIIVNNPTKIYNGSTDADVPGADIQLSAADATAGTPTDDGEGLIAGETLAITPTATASYDSADATNFNGAGAPARSRSRPPWCRAILRRPARARFRTTCCRPARRALAPSTRRR